MTRGDVRAWLSSCEPQPPLALVEHLDAVVAAAPESAFVGESMAEVAGRLGLATLRGVVKRHSVAYDTALDLLAADAFVTYAFEAAAQEGGDVEGLARRLVSEVLA